MPTVDVYNIERNVIGQLELSERFLRVPVKPHVMHEVVLVPIGQAPGRNGEDQGTKRDCRRRQETLAAERAPGGPVRERADRPSGEGVAPSMGRSPGPMTCESPRRFAVWP